MTDEFDWEELLLFIEDRDVVPVVGRELLTISDNGTTNLVDSFLAASLAEELRVDRDGLGSAPDLNAVAAQYIRGGGPRAKVYSKLRAIMGRSDFAVPEPLMKLAEITDFDLYVSTTFDSLMAQALDNVRFGGDPGTRTLSYSPHRQVVDLPIELEHLGGPHVYQIFGPLSSSPEYAVTDEDHLEFLHRLQSELHRPKLLFDEFRHYHLLFLGCGYPDWLTRFFVRTLSNDRLGSRETSEKIADRRAVGEVNLSMFLRDCRIEVFPEGGAVEFIDQLHDRWTERHPHQASETAPTSRPAAASPKMVPGSIFLSYASEDQELVDSWRAALEDAHLDVWFDKQDLQPGDAWDLMIKSNIRRCDLFMPFVSRRSQSRREGYFRREWRWALDRAEAMAESLPFIVPVILDETQQGAENIPAGFWRNQAIRALGGRPTDEVVVSIKQTLERVRSPEAARDA
jgi:hypothetical protein